MNLRDYHYQTRIDSTKHQICHTCQNLLQYCRLRCRYHLHFHWSRRIFDRSRNHSEGCGNHSEGSGYPTKGSGYPTEGIGYPTEGSLGPMDLLELGSILPMVASIEEPLAYHKILDLVGIMAPSISASTSFYFFCVWQERIYRGFAMCSLW